MKTMWRDDLSRNTNPFRFLLFSSRPYRAAMIGALLAIVIGSILDASISYFLKLLVNAANALTTGGSAQDLWNITFVFIAVTVASTLFWRAGGFIGMRWSTGVRLTARYSLSSYVTKHGYEYFSNRFAGSILSKIASAANSTKEMCEQLLWQFTGFVVQMISSFLLIYFTNHLLAYIFMAWVALITPLNVYIARGRVRLSAASQKDETALGGATVDMLTNMSAVHEYAHRTFELNRLQKFIAKRRASHLRSWRYSETVLLVNGLLANTFIGSLIVGAVYFTVQGIFSPGDVILILTLVLSVDSKLISIGQQLSNFADSWGQVADSLEDILEVPDVPDKAEALPLLVRSGAMTFENVTFDYSGTTVFNDLSLTIPNGQKVGLVGRSGAGKSTLIKLILRHYDLTGGRILIDGADIAGVTKESLRSQIAVVPQEPLLFHRAIRENIAYGNVDATEEEIIHAAKLAEADDFILKLPEGYGALVGERGVKLSGGQRQRIAIARAMLKNAPILLLDEATSALDSESEVAVQKALLALMENRTVIAIAHRLSTLRVMDRIIVMDDGHIIEDGTHAELLERGGLYATLWNHQAGGFLEEEKDMV